MRKEIVTFFGRSGMYLIFGKILLNMYLCYWYLRKRNGVKGARHHCRWDPETMSLLGDVS